MAILLPPVPRWWKSTSTISARPSVESVSGAICSRKWSVLGLGLVAGMTLFYGLGSSRTFSSHEIFAVVPAREMIENDNWVFPTFGGLPRLRKPPLAYWIVAGSAHFFGELSPLTARIPSAMAGLLLAGLMGVWAGRWYGTRIGWAAAFVQLTSVWFLMFARKAEIDMVLCLFTTSAMFLVADQPDDETRNRSYYRWLGFYGLLSLAWLAKFHYGPALVLAPVLVFFVVNREWRKFRLLAHPLGLLCFAAAIVVWPLLVLEQAPAAWEVWRRETLGRAIGEMGRHPMLFFFPFLVWLPLPWLPFGILKFRQSWQAAWKDRNLQERFLWVWLGVQLAILTLSANKHKHYLMATLPVFTLFAARGLSETLQKLQDGRLRVPPRWAAVFISGNMLIGIAVFWLLQSLWPELWVANVILAFTVSCCESMGWVFLARRQVAAMLAVNLGSLLLGGLVIVGWHLPHCDRRVDVQEFAHTIRQSFLPKDPVCVFCMDRDPLVYHLGSPVFRAESLEDLERTLRQSDVLYLVGYEHRVKDLHAIGELSALARLPKGENDLEPVEGDLVFVKLIPRILSADAALHSASAN